MRFTVDSRELTASILSVIKALPVRTTLPCLEGIFVDAKNDGISLKCSDLMLQKECIVRGDVFEEGQSIIPGKLVSEFVRKLPSGHATISTEGNSISISCGRVKTVLQAIDFEEFPEMEFDGDNYTIEIDRDDCKKMITGTVFATAQDDSKPILNGVLMEISDSITAVSTDAYQFAMIKVPLKNAIENKKAVIPARALNEISHVLDETEKDVRLTFTRTHVKFDIGHTCLIARMLEGNYIDYKRILPTEYKTRVIVDRGELVDSIDRAQLMAREGNNNIVMNFTGKKLSISARSFIGNFNEEIDVQTTGEDVEIAFNPKYCLNILRNISDEKICVDLLSGISPCVIRPLQGESYYYLIVPVRVFSQY